MKKTLIREKTTATLLIAIFMISTFAFTVSAVPFFVEEYTYCQSIQVDGSSSYLSLDVTEDGEWVTWTFDFPVEDFTGDGNLNVGLIIATDGDGEGPAFQIHNNDGTDSSFDWGTWLMSPWGPTISDGWNGWHSGDTNTEVDTLAWVEASGNRNVPHGEGVMTISIHESKLGRKFHWAVSPTVGSGFYAPMYDVTMQLPSAFTWSSPLVDMDEPNYMTAEIYIPPTPPVKSGGPTFFEGVTMGTLWNTPHKLIVVGLRDAPDDHYYQVAVMILAENGTLVYTRSFYVRPTAATLSLYCHEDLFPEDYSVVVTCEIGSLPYIVASRDGIERKSGY